MCELSINKAFKIAAFLTTKQKQATEARLNILVEQIVNGSENNISCKRESLRNERALLESMQTAEAISMFKIMFMITVRITANTRRDEQNTCASTRFDTKHLLETNTAKIILGPFSSLSVYRGLL